MNSSSHRRKIHPNAAHPAPLPALRRKRLVHRELLLLEADRAPVVLNENGVEPLELHPLAEAQLEKPPELLVLSRGALLSCDEHGTRRKHPQPIDHRYTNVMIFIHARPWCSIHAALLRGENVFEA